MMDIFQKKDKLDNSLVFYTGICLGAVGGVLVTNLYFYFTSNDPVTPRLVRAKTRQIVAMQHPSEEPQRENQPVDTINDEPVDTSRDELIKESSDKAEEPQYQHLALLQMVAQDKQPIKKQLTQEEQLLRLQYLVAKHSTASKN